MLSPEPKGEHEAARIYGSCRGRGGMADGNAGIAAQKDS
jgi:hypothetical protein